MVTLMPLLPLLLKLNCHHQQIPCGSNSSLNFSCLSFLFRSFIDGEPFTDSEVVGCWAFAGCCGRFLHMLHWIFLHRWIWWVVKFLCFSYFISFFLAPTIFHSIPPIFPTYFVLNCWYKLHCFNIWTVQVVNVFKQIFIIWLKNRCLIVQSAYNSQPKGYLNA